jgi:tRNA pseudouridine38-40 synthase
MRNIKLLVAYDGTSFKGWQATAAGPSIEEALTSPLRTITRQPIKLQAASRTDAGVHARGQVVNFIDHAENFTSDKLAGRLNQMLPPAISVLSVEEMALSFHPTIDSCGKEYRYYICNSRFQMPHRRFYSWHCRHPLDIGAMESATAALCGEHDFTSFCNVSPAHNYAHYRRTITAFEIHSLPHERLCFVVRGNDFLYRMVRNLVGTVVYVGLGKIDATAIPSILQGCSRSLAGITAPAHGLFLEKVFY